MTSRTDAVVSYVVSGGTASVSLQAGGMLDLTTWDLQDWGVVIGVVGVCIRAYIDISRHLDRKRGLERRRNDRTKR